MRMQAGISSSMARMPMPHFPSLHRLHILGNDALDSCQLNDLKEAKWMPRYEFTFPETKGLRRRQVCVSECFVVGRAGLAASWQ